MNSLKRTVSLLSAILILTFFTSVFSYPGSMHSQIIRNMPNAISKHIKDPTLGNQAIIDTINKYLSIMEDGVVSPDNDYSQYTIPTDLLPAELKPYNTSLVKWEHYLPNDVPKPIEDALRTFSKDIIHTEFMYADNATLAWFMKAQTFYRNGQTDSAMYHLGRCCHLIEDVTVPMHCKMSGAIVDVWQTLQGKEPNHEKFERICNEQYSTLSYDYDLGTITNIRQDLRSIAADSRVEYRLCDGIGYPNLTRNPYIGWITYFFPFLREDYNAAVQESCENAEKYTAELIIFFFNNTTAK